MLEHEKVFFARADIAVVAALYASFFDAVVPEQQALTFSKLGWTAREASKLAAALPHFGSLQRLE